MIQDQSINSISPINAPITISDIVVAAPMLEKKIPNSEQSLRSLPVGEYDDLTADETTQLDRLFSTIEKLADLAADEHKKNNFINGQLLSERQNHITRIITNEFFFYTKVPLTLEEFKNLNQKLQALAESLPLNLHLILSSFAVKTPEGKIMNVVAHIECGIAPKIHFLVKNSSSAIDPSYKENFDGKVVFLPYVNINRDTLPPGFSFDPILTLETAGKAKMFTCVEVCVDHGYGRAKNKLDNIFEEKKKSLSEEVELFPFQCSHIVTSNSISLKNDNILGSLTHADPVFSSNMENTNNKLFFNDFNFGTSFSVYYANPIECGLLPSEKLSDIVAFNQAKKAQNPFLEISLELLQKRIPGDTFLLVAARNGEFEICKTLIDEGADLHAKHNETGMNALHLAAQNGHVEICMVLIDRGVDVNAITNSGSTALGAAAFFGHQDLCLKLIEKNADVNLKDSIGYTALLYAAENGYTEICKLLISSGADPKAYNIGGMNALHLAAQNNHVEVCMALIDIMGIDIDIKNQFRGYTAFHYALMNGNIELCKELIRRGADVNATTNDGRNALHLAAQNGHTEICIFLIENAGLEINTKDQSQGYTALHYAIMNGNIELCKELIRMGANVDATTDNDINALQLAVKNNRKNIAVELIANNAKIDPSAEELNTHLLLCAAEINNIKACSLLLNAGVDINSQEKGYTALHVAIINGFTELCENLIQNGAEVNPTISDPRNALHLAAYYGKTEICIFFIKSRLLEINTHEKLHGYTALHFAILNGHIELCKELIRIGANVNATTNDGTNALQLAADKGFYNICMEIIASNANIDSNNKSLNNNLLLYAAENGNIEVCKKLIAAGVALDNCNSFGKNALHLAAEHGHTEICLALIDAGVEINTQNPLDNYTALHYAIKNNNLELCKKLIEKEANVDAITINGYSPFLLANYNYNSDIGLMLIENNAKIDLSAKEFNTHLLLYAVRTNNIKVYISLLNAGVDINSKENGSTALHWAITNNNIELCKELIRRGADVNAVANDGSNALQLAANNGFYDICMEIIASNGNIDSNNKYINNNLLIYAAQNGNTEVCKKLIAAGVAVDIYDSYGQNPLHLAAVQGHTEVCLTLIDAGIGIDTQEKLYGYTALHWAIVSGNIELCRELIDRGANVNATTKDGSNALQLAASFNHEIFEMLSAEKLDNTHTRSQPLIYSMKKVEKELPAKESEKSPESKKSPPLK